MKTVTVLNILPFLFFLALSDNASPKISDSIKPATLGDQVKILLEALSHYKSSDPGKKTRYTIAIVHDRSVPDHTIAEIQAAFEGNDSVKVKGMTFGIQVIAFVSKEDLRKKLEEAKVSCVFISEGNEKCIREITAITRDLQILSMTNVSDYVHWLGVTLGVEEDENKLKTMVNLAGCQQEKIDFDEHILGEASVYF